MSKQTSVVELPSAHAENPVGKSVAVKRKRGRPAKQTRAKVDETAETASTSAEHSCGKSSAAKRGKHTKPMSTTDSKAFILEELQKEDGGWFTIKPAVTIAIPTIVVSIAECELSRTVKGVWLCSTPRCEDEGNIPRACSIAPRGS